MEKYEKNETLPSSEYDIYTAEYIRALFTMFQPLISYGYPTSTSYMPLWKGQVTQSHPTFDERQNSLRYFSDLRQLYAPNFSPLAIEFLRNLPRNRQMVRTCNNVRKRRGHLGTAMNHKDYWELNRRRPSVIRRSIGSDSKCLSPREAILEPILEFNKSVYEMRTEQQNTPLMHNYPQSQPTIIHTDPQNEHSLHTCMPKNHLLSIHKDPRRENEKSPLTQNKKPTCVPKDPQRPSITPNHPCAIPNSPLSEHRKSPITPKQQQHSLQSTAFQNAREDGMIEENSLESPVIDVEPNLSIESQGKSDLTDGRTTRIWSSQKTENPQGTNSKKDKKYKFCCFHCKKRFRWFSHWQAHERTHTGERPYKCPQCDRCFTRGDGLQAHMIIHSTMKPHKCNQCAKVFARKFMLERHIVEHTGVIPYTCEICKLEILAPESIEGHLNQHDGLMKIKCQYCCRSFTNARKLASHIRVHTGEKPLACSQCKMRFTKKSALAIHQRVHSGIKPYACSDCGKSFSIAGNLRRHALIHTGERPYPCLKCKKRFNNKSHLARHVASQHGKE